MIVVSYLPCQLVQRWEYIRVLSGAGAPPQNISSERSAMFGVSVRERKKLRRKYYRGGI